ncbi:MAG: alpha/beta fold hydrolase [Candidatus Eremiobacteraeota bacterium]|nr:alpha/beta fold hydrolase [Candidatus Eremiobacteraeota bacterium]
MTDPLSPELYSEVQGQGSPVLMIAGVASDTISWQLQVSALRDQFKMVLFDNQGVGRSPVPDHPITIEQMAWDAVRVLDRHQVEKAHIVGHSMGTAIAQTLARLHPDRVEKMVLAAPFPRLDARARLAVESWVMGLREKTSQELFGRALFPWLFTEQFLAQDGVFELCLDGFKSHPYPLTASGLQRQWEALEGFNSTGWLSRVGAPTLLLAGSQDILTPASQAHTMSQLMPNAEVKLLDAGHSALVECADEFNQAVSAFLG